MRTGELPGGAAISAAQGSRARSRPGLRPPTPALPACSLPVNLPACLSILTGPWDAGSAESSATSLGAVPLIGWAARIAPTSGDGHSDWVPSGLSQNYHGTTATNTCGCPLSTPWQRRVDAGSHRIHVSRMTNDAERLFTSSLSPSHARNELPAQAFRPLCVSWSLTECVTRWA